MRLNGSVPSDPAMRTWTRHLLSFQEELQLLQRQLEEREAELRRLRDEGSRLRAEGHGRADGAERGGWGSFNNCLEASRFMILQSGFSGIRQIDAPHSNNSRVASSNRPRKNKGFLALITVSLLHT